MTRVLLVLTSALCVMSSTATITHGQATRNVTVSPSSVFREVLRTGDRSKNPSGTGGFPFDKASAAVGRQIVEDRTARIGDAIGQVLRAK